MIIHGAGHEFHGGRDWGVSPGAPVSPLLRGHHTRELPLEIRPRSNRQAPLLGLVRGSAILSFIRALFQSTFFGPHVARLRIDGPISLPMRHHHFLLGIRLSHWLVVFQVRKYLNFC